MTALILIFIASIIVLNLGAIVGVYLGEKYYSHSQNKVKTDIWDIKTKNLTYEK